MTVDVLLVEDDDADAALIAGMFARTRRSAPFRVHWTVDLAGADAILSGFRATSGAAVVLDLSVADRMETTALAWIRTNAVAFPVLVLTGNDDEALPREALRAGAQDYLTKWDFDGDALTRAILYARERHRGHQELRQAKEAAESASRAKTEFLANMSHEIRTPLAAVLGAAELLAESSLGSDQRQYLELLTRAGTHLRALVDEILDLAKIEAGGIVLERTGFVVGQVLDDVCALLRPRAESKGLTFVGDSALDPSPVTGDPHRLRQVLVNLVGNAVKFTAHGEVRLRAEKEGGRDVVRFTVADTGIGIAPTHQGLIFEAFTQTDASTTRVHGGTGLGLTIARRLVELMGGQLVVKSAVDVGSEFTFSLRLPPGEIAAAASLVEDPFPEPGERPGHRRWRVVVADDAAENRQLLAAFLRAAPYDVEFVTSGEQALEAYARAQPDVMLLDLHMPTMDGLATARRIRALEAAERRLPVPLVAYTADAFNDTRQRCLVAGFTDHLVKPVSRATLCETIARALRSSGAAAARPVTPLSKPGEVDEDLRALLPGYLERRLGDVVTMRGALRQADHQVLRDIAHRIKGSGGSYGLAAVSALAARIEAAVDDARPDLVEGHLHELEEHLAAARHLLAHGDPGGAPRRSPE